MHEQMQVKGNNKMIDAHIIMMHSNRTSILLIDPALVPLLGFDANNKILFLRNHELPKDLSISNAVIVNRSSETYPLRLNAGITLRHKC
jgi:hypothetical protein